MNKLPERKRIRLKGFDYSYGTCYFVTICTRQKRCILSSIEPIGQPPVARVQLSPLGQIAQECLIELGQSRSGVIVDSFVIMPNHIHVLLIIDNSEATPIDLHRVVRYLKSSITKKAGESLFQPRFFDHIIRDEFDYENHRNYIESNPENWETDELR